MVQLIEPDADDVHNELVSCGKHINVEIPQLHLELLQLFRCWCSESGQAVIIQEVNFAKVASCLDR